MKSLDEPRSSSDLGCPTLQGCARLKKFELGLEITWDATESKNLEAKLLGEQVTNVSGINLGSG